MHSITLRIIFVMAPMARSVREIAVLLHSVCLFHLFFDLEGVERNFYINVTKPWSYTGM
jgi:hypothetical protein